MRDQWYGDKRDLIKWGVLLELARRHGARHILQVLYYRPSCYGSLDIAVEQCKLPSAVLHHFRRLSAVTAISCEVKIHVIEDLFEDRQPYLDLVVNRIHSRPPSPGIVFLDPDTGLAPSRSGSKHVRNEELNKIWEQLRTGDLLVFYQHQTNRKGAPWIDEKKAQFERAIALPSGAAKVAWGPSIAKDVVFFFIKKRSHSERIIPRNNRLRQAEMDAALGKFRRTRATIAKLSAPGKSGVYAISLRTRKAFAGFPEGKDRLIYIGQCRNLVHRIFGQHFSTGKTGSSALRRSLGALLKHELSLKAIPRAPGPLERNVLNYRFDPDSEDRLTKWMCHHLEVGVHASPNYDALEHSLVQRFRPLLNLTTWPNPYRDKIKQLHNECADEARKAWRAGKA